MSKKVCCEKGVLDHERGQKMTRRPTCSSREQSLLGASGRSKRRKSEEGEAEQGSGMSNANSPSLQNLCVPGLR